MSRFACRSCGEVLHPVHDYGELPLAGAFPRLADVGSEQYFPLTLAICPGCGLVQTAESVSADILFRDYRYLASVPLRHHFELYAEHVPDRLGWNATDLILEVGCNDGVLLHPLKARGFRSLVGVDPASNVTAHVDPEIPVEDSFFGFDVASSLCATHGEATAILANNVFAHVEDPNDFVAGVAALLAPNGSFVFEVHYLADLVDQYQYDTVYHEHVFYYSLSALRPLLERHGLRLWDVERLANHGGSVRVYSCPQGSQRVPTEALRVELEKEDARGLGQPEALMHFASGVQARIAALDRLMEEIAGDGLSIAAFGAAGRATILFNVVQAVGANVAYVVDESPERVGRVMPGTHNPIVPLGSLGERPPDVLLLSAWSYADALRRKVTGILPRERLPRFCVPLPTPHVLP